MATIGLVGDYDARILAHRAIPEALRLASRPEAIAHFQWLPTQAITDAAALTRFDGLWCVPGSPYASLEGALTAIRYAREARRPFLGTCGGFQHAVIEFARNVLGWANAEHAETAPDAQRLVITPLECALVETTAAIILKPDTCIAHAYGCLEIIEGYHCRYGINPECLAALTAAGLDVAAEDRAGDVRALELDEHPFFVATLFQPERAALKGICPPLVAAFLAACDAHTPAPPALSR